MKIQYEFFFDLLISKRSYLMCVGLNLLRNQGWLQKEKMSMCRRKGFKKGKFKALKHHKAEFLLKMKICKPIKSFICLRLRKIENLPEKDMNEILKVVHNTINIELVK